MSSSSTNSHSPQESSVQEEPLGADEGLLVVTTGALSTRSVLPALASGQGGLVAEPVEVLPVLDEFSTASVLERIVKVDPLIPVTILKAEDEISLYYRKLGELSRSESAVVYECVDMRNEHNKLAMKVQSKIGTMSNPGDDPHEQLFKLYKELVIVSRILPRHKNIVELKDLLVSEDDVYILTEFCVERLTLNDFFRVAEDNNSRRTFKQLSEGVRFMHQHGVVHLNLEPQNILFSDPHFEECKIIAFGQAAYSSELATLNPRGFEAEKWFNPEEIQTAGRDWDVQKDIRSLGRILHAMLVRKWTNPATVDKWKPLKRIFDRKSLDLLGGIGPGSFGPPTEDGFLTMDEICAHPWLTEEGPNENFKDYNNEVRILQKDLTVIAQLLKPDKAVPLIVLHEDLEIDNHYQRFGELQTGATLNKVYDCVHLKCVQGIKLAMKVIPKSGEKSTRPGDDPGNALFRFYRELMILTKILPRHKNVVEVKDLLVSKDFVYIVTEICEKYTLEDFFPFAKNASSRKVFKQIADTVRFLHLYGVVHMDLKPQHVLFTDTVFTNCKIIDFGRSAYVSEMASLVNDNFEANRWFNADQLIMSGKYGRPEVDIRSLGRILHAMLVGKWVPDAMLTTSKLRKGLFEACALDLLSKIGPEPFGPPRKEQHITMDDICRHPWLAQS